MEMPMPCHLMQKHLYYQCINAHLVWFLLIFYLLIYSSKLLFYNVYNFLPDNKLFDTDSKFDNDRMKIKTAGPRNVGIVFVS